MKRLCPYGARGPLSPQRLELLPDGRVSYRMKRPAPDGSAHLVLPPLDFARIAALIPPPRVHLTRFHGVFAPAARRRKSVVPQPNVAPEGPDIPPQPQPILPPAPATRIPWACIFPTQVRPPR